MKIHMDYLENKVEQFQAQQSAWEKEQKKLSNQVEMANEKLKLIRDQKEREIKDLNKKLNDLTVRFKGEKDKILELENKLHNEREIYKEKLKSQIN